MIKESKENRNIYEVSKGNYFPPLRFEGELLARVTVAESDEKWIEVYKTSKGKLVCASPEFACVFTTMEELAKYIEYNPLAISLYTKIGYKYWETVE